ncbi:hypothetical protein CcI49_17590 [Frankia sp. CcI49]|uniref:Uncharacterized protein n=1 Tax=Parafrankia irregularis TaxID=795642 RepID=A0A0S4QL66_9ACTN|nr:MULTISPECIES: hypothetical protein [Frankiaceae]KPM51642.1 hypothetical protein ACG83_32865 [Frankia sp. R43]MBE3201176.1 hypothetical protein [Parafrankia sp. CH37]ONH59264.1 hypothetical protein CcI49_17590 [Frankia sp. CcI49]CUU56389.1 hypothetical protein Ga0074812_107273 [Parafrankia irregularis]
MSRVELPESVHSDRHGLAAASRAAAMLSREIAYADPDPLTMAEFDDRLHRYATTLLTTPPTLLLRPVISDWRRAQAALGRRLSPATHRELTGIAGFLSFYLGVLAVESGDDPSARRFATLTDQFAAQLDDPLLTGTAATLDALVAFVTGRYDAAAGAARRAAAAGHPYLCGWAAAIEAAAAATLGDSDTALIALDRLATRPCVQGLRHPGWPAFDEVREACAVADVVARMGGDSAADLARIAVDLTSSGTIERGWALACLASALAPDDPPQASRLLGDIVAILDVHPSRMLSRRVNEIVSVAGPGLLPLIPYTGPAEASA